VSSHRERQVVDGIRTFGCSASAIGAEEGTEQPGIVRDHRLADFAESATVAGKPLRFQSQSWGHFVQQAFRDRFAVVGPE
jgi:hypothetical protein